MDRFDALVEIAARLRAEGGCPWDRAQSPHTMRPYVLEEAYEVLDALDRRDQDELRCELGDMLFQVVMLAQMARESSWFDIDEVLAGEKALFKLESTYAETHQELPARLFLGIGDQEEQAPFSALGHRGTIVSVSDFYRFAAILQERGYDGLQFTKRVFTGFDHTDVPGPIFAAGLRYVFKEIPA